jgi:hypothetical protein
MSNSSPPGSPLHIHTPPLRSAHQPRPRRVHTLPPRLVDTEPSAPTPSLDTITTLFYVDGARITAIGGGSTTQQGSSGSSSRPVSRAGAGGDYPGFEGDGHIIASWNTPSDRTLAVGKFFAFSSRAYAYMLCILGS